MIKNKKQAGFTIVELLMVITILGYLYSIGLSSFQNAKDKAYNAVLRNQLNNYITGIGVYRVQNGVWPDPIGYGLSVAPTPFASQWCLGQTDVDLNADGLSNCSNILLSPGWVENSGFNTQLASVGVPRGKYSDGCTPTYDTSVGLNCGVSAYFYNYGQSIDGIVGKTVVFEYYLKGTNQNCSIRGAESGGWLTAAWPLYTTSRGRNYWYFTSYTGKISTSCILFLNTDTLN
jgi:prepilin-type N-terminal cleavage/methylation domain-containing protein